MKPVFQDRYGSADGNCFEACLASILELPLTSIPDFVRNNPPDWWDRAVRWLAMNRMYSGVWMLNDGAVPLGYHIAGCDKQITTDGDIGHVVVALDGVPVHCPVHGTPRIPDGIDEWFLLIPFGDKLQLRAEKPATSEPGG